VAKRFQRLKSYFYGYSQSVSKQRDGGEKGKSLLKERGVGEPQKDGSGEIRVRVSVSFDNGKG